VVDISRIDLADFVTPEQIVQGILNLAPNITIPVPIEELARALDITNVEGLETDGFEGGLITDVTRSEGVILVNQKSPLQRRRFTIGHELGHFLCPWHNPTSTSGFMCTSEDMNMSDARKTDRAALMEVEANRFSALLLMPLPQFRKDVRRHNEVDINHILELAKRYLTSKEATARRYVEVQDETCAAIISHDGRIQRYYKNKEFPFLAITPGVPVPKGSLTARMRHSDITSISECQETMGYVWLEEHGRRVPMLYEQVLNQRDGYQLTLLTLAEDPDELEEDDELEEAWTPRFRR
jgi:hypothetical protein